MIAYVGTWAQHAQTFLLALSIPTTLLFALPLLLAPMRWAKLMMWRIPDDRDLANYLGRCLGAFILLVEFLMFRAGIDRTSIETTFQVMLLLWTFMLAIHIWGAIEGTQPITETLEIGFWAVLFVLTLLCWPVAG